MSYSAFRLKRQLLAVSLTLAFISLADAQDSFDPPQVLNESNTPDEQMFRQILRATELPSIANEVQSPAIAASSGLAKISPVEQILPGPKEEALKIIQFEQVPLSEAMKLFAKETGLNILCSADAGNTPITVYLHGVDPVSALEAIVKANGLFYRIDNESGIFRISTAEEYEKDLTSFREEQTRVFTLLYPNPVAVAQVIGQIYGDRVDLNMADADTDELNDLSQRFNRFDLVDGRALVLGTFDSTGNSLSGTNNSGLGIGLGIQPGGGLTGRSRSRSLQNPSGQNQRSSNLSAREMQEIESRLAAVGDGSAESRARLMQEGKATIYVSTIRRNNQIVVRTADVHSMAEIEQLILELDVPTPTVLLEVKVLRVELADGVNSAFEYFSQGGEAASGFSDGNPYPAFPGANAAGRALASGLGVAGSVPGSLTFQLVDQNFQFRMQALESQNRVTALATPLILTANNEVSRIFVGDTLPFTVGFTPSQVIGGVNATSGAVSATPITELRDVGQSLLITPNINADRTVTLRVVEENSERILGGASIPIPDAAGVGVTSVNVDTVRRRTVSGTMVAQDGMAVALGGLIEERVSNSLDRIPILGNIPGIGFLFRRHAENRSRSELVVVIRPCVFSTPSESAAKTKTKLQELSLHPNSPELSGDLNTYLACDVIRAEPECRERAKLFRFHNVKDSR
ncbi:type II secretion system protein GspD [Rhodopirellula bahusiensis]|uniref:type II secretion system protein GspD n=1 Tax=Rhodopirellula bahusiensis TaxID=2014065 RepID=UPI003264BE67